MQNEKDSDGLLSYIGFDPQLTRRVYVGASLTGVID